MTKIHRGGTKSNLYNDTEYAPFSSDNLNLAKSADNIMSGEFIAKNYSSIYKTTGGGKSSNKAVNFAKKFIDNRVLDLYLKILGITTLTPATLVPIALIFGQQAFQKAMKDFKKREQTGGSLPIIDNALLGTYLKIAGLTQLSLSLNTLVPLGLAMAIYETYKDNLKKNNQSGGHISKLFVGNSVPPGSLQLNHKFWNGETIQNNIYAPLNSFGQQNRDFSFMNMEQQPYSVSVIQPSSQETSSVHVPAISSESSNLTPTSETPSIDTESTTNDVLVLPNSMA